MNNELRDLESKRQGLLSEIANYKTQVRTEESNEPQREKTDICICEADQRLCFRHTDSAIPLLPKSGISSL